MRLYQGICMYLLFNYYLFLLAYLWYNPLGLIQLMTDHIFATKHWINIQILYREFSSENFDYYGITDETLCHYAS
jgi:hypothetical protein